jgi:amidase
MSDLDRLAELDAVAQAELVAKGELSAGDLLDAFERRLRAVNPLIRAVVSADLDGARARPVAATLGPFNGVPFLVKDVVAYPNLRWSMGSRVFATNVAREGSPLTTRMDRAGLVTVGKTATSEFGLLGSTETLLEGVTHNPWDLSLSAAGSSGGAAAAVAAGIVPLAHANDGGGSIRVPASVCGVFGLKPSRGRCVPSSAVRSDFADLVEDLAIARSVRDVALYLSTVEARGDDAVLHPVGYVREPSTKRLRIGLWSTTLFGAEPEADVRDALDAAVALLGEMGHEVRPVAPPKIDAAALSVAFFACAGVALGDVADTLAAMLGRPIGPDDFEPFTLALIDEQRKAGVARLQHAREVFAECAAAYLGVFDASDVILTPTLATRPWKLGHLSPMRSRAELVGRTERTVAYTPIHNIAGCPAMSVPLHWTSDGVPIGIHFAARPGAEAVLLGLAYELEEARPWQNRWAPFSFPTIIGAGWPRS